MTVPDPSADQAINQGSLEALGPLVGKQVSVSLSGPAFGHQRITGILIAADPITKSVVLITKSEEDCSVKVLPFVSNVEKDYSDSADEELIALANQLISKLKRKPVDSKVLASRKASVKGWLESNLLQVAEEGEEDLVIQGCVRLCPPYSQDDCIATNEIILSRVVELISSQQ